MSDKSILTRTNLVYNPFKSLGQKFNNSFFPHFTKSWNNIDISLKSEGDLPVFKENLKTKMKPKRHKHFSRGSKRGNSLITQLRLGRSQLNSDRFSIGLAESPSCPCHHHNENTEHYLINCFLFTLERQILFDTVEKLLPKFKNLSKINKMNVLLNGINLNSNEIDSRNVPLTLAVQKFIFCTKRF